MIGIYKITNIVNNKAYIGQSVRIERRIAEHRQSALRGDDEVLYRAMRKYGLQNFQYEVICECEPSQLDELEQYYIQQYHTLLPNGYNYQLGGSTGKIVVPDNIYAAQQALMFTDKTQQEIADECNICRRTVIRINLGEVWHNEKYSYPLRKPKVSENPTHKCIDCGAPVSLGALRCLTCSALHQQHCSRPNPEELESLIIQFGFVGVGRKFGVSDNAVRKWCRQYNMPTHTKDYKK